MPRRIAFPFERRVSRAFGRLYRPVALGRLWSRKHREWLSVPFLVDSGADYTVLPYRYVADLGIRLDRDCRALGGEGIGGRERVYLVRRWPLRIGPWGRRIPIGFLLHDRVPPLLGRMGCLDAFRVTFHRRRTILSW